jgi:hypothetical protein
MTPPASLGQRVASYRFWDIVRMWARERLEHEEIVARALAGACIADGLRVQSVDARWAGQGGKDLPLNGNPYVGFCARPDTPLSILRATALEHLLAIVHRAETPSPERLSEEFVTREDFLSWCARAGIPAPRFWAGESRSD